MRYKNLLLRKVLSDILLMLKFQHHLSWVERPFQYQPLYPGFETCEKYKTCAISLNQVREAIVILEFHVLFVFDEHFSLNYKQYFNFFSIFPTRLYPTSFPSLYSSSTLPTNHPPTSSYTSPPFPPDPHQPYIET